MPSTTFIDTNSLPRTTTPHGQFTEILNGALTGAKNVLGVLRWIRPGESFKADAKDKHQLLYLMEGAGRINLENKDHDVTKAVSYTHLRAHETPEHLVCRLLLEKK